MPVPVFHYFKCKALGESSRLLMAYGDYKFEDHRISMADWPAYRPQTPFGQMPVLELDGKQYAQSAALARYFGRKFKLNGTTEEDELEIDAIVEYLHDIRAKGAVVYYEKDAAHQAAKHADFAKNAYPEMLERLAKIIEKNNGHLALGKLTWADFVFTGMFENLKVFLRIPDLESQYPIFKKVHEAVLNIPKVKKYADLPQQGEPALPF